MRRLSLLLAFALLSGGCVPIVTTASSTPTGQATIERAVQSALARAGLAETPPTPDVAPGLIAGPMLADVTHRGAAIWVQAQGALEVTVRATPVDRSSVLEASSSTYSDGTATVRLFGMKPGMTYDYIVALDGQPIDLEGETQFQTQELWQWRTDPPTFTAAIGSCYYSNDAPFDRPGDGYGGPTSIFREIDALSPDLMLWLGDNTYLREVDWWSPEGIDYRYRQARSARDLQPLLAGTAHYATWDDHDYGPNDSDRSYVLKDDALDTFKRFWPSATRGIDGVPGVFTHFQWADVDFFMLDDRYHRSPNDAPDGEQTILGRVQLQWLLDALTSSQAPFKVIANGGQILNPIDVFETYSAIAPAERQFLLDEITRREIDGVVMLSGDRHHTELMRLERPGTYPIYEFTSSPLTAGASTYALREDSPEYVNPLRVPGTLVAGVYNFGTLTVEGARTDRTLTMRTYDLEGELLWEQAVRARELQTPRSE